MILSAYTYMTKEKKAVVHLELTENIYNVNSNPEIAFKYKETGNLSEVTGNSFPPLKDVVIATNVEIVENGRKISMLLEKPGVDTELRIVDNNNNIVAKVILNFIESTEKQSTDSNTNEKKKHINVLAIDTNGMFRIWRDTYEWDFGNETLLTARIIDPSNNKVVALLKGYHVRKVSFGSTAYNAWPSIQNMDYYGGVDVYKHLYLLEPMETKEYTFLCEVGSSKEVFYTSVYYDSVNETFSKSLPPEEGWRAVGTNI